MYKVKDLCNQLFDDVDKLEVISDGVIIEHCMIFQSDTIELQSGMIFRGKKH